MMVASSSELGKSEILSNLADDLTTLVRRSIASGASLDELERGVFQKVLLMGRAAVNLFLEGQGDGDLGVQVETQDGALLYRSATVMPRRLRTIFGEHCFKAFVYARDSKQKIELRPIDARLNLPHNKGSYLFEEFTQLFCVEKAFGVGARQFEAVFGQQVSVDVLEKINRRMGAQADRFFDDLKAPAAADEGELLVATADGKGVPLVQQDAQKIPVFDEKERRPGNRRMATLGCVYTVNRHIRTPEQIVAALFHDKTETPPEERPEPCGKRYRGYFTYSEPGQEPIPSAYRTWTWLAQEVTARHQAGQPIIRLMDGQPSLWNAADACLDEFVEQLRQTRDKGVIDILDIIHASIYVWRAAKVFHTHQEHQEAFAHERLLRILRGEVSGVVKGLRRMATEHELRGAQLKEVSTVCNYFENNAHRMRYDEYLKAGYPIASGVIEGACRHIIKDRMEQGGMRWRLAGAEAMLNVRAVNASSEWEAFGRWRQLEEAKRVHPHQALVSEYRGFTA